MRARLLGEEVVRARGRLLGLLLLPPLVVLHRVALLHRLPAPHRVRVG
jgi:hypothetical protein